ncbi:MAG: hypothetical protein ABJD53_11785 [Gammaproteobacteria bacterium]
MTKGGLVILPAFSLVVGAVLASAAEVTNVTGLPAYPNLQTAKMDERTRTDRLGRQCAHFAATSFDPLALVEIWYRKNLSGASETDLHNDENYSNPSKVSGIKLAIGIDYVIIYRVPNQSFTAIELFRCSPRS